MKTLHKVAFSLLAALLPLFSFAHGYWIEVEGSHKVNEPVTVRLYYGDYPDGERVTGKYLDKMKDIKVFVQRAGAKAQPVAMQQKDEYWEGSFVPQQDASYEITGINEEREVQDWTKHGLGITRPVQYLKAYYTTGETHMQAENTKQLDAVVRKTSDNAYELTLTRKGQPLAAQKLTVSAFGKEVQELATDDSGKILLTLETPGLHILSVDHIDPTPGSFRGKEYESIRYRLDYSIYHH